MKKEEKLQKAFQYVRNIFFPRWDKKGEWRIVYDKDFGIPGQCQSSGKKIFIGVVCQEKDRLYCLLIHEICHVWGEGLHRDDWQRRMAYRREKAYAMSMTFLGDLIQQDIEFYRSPSGKEEDDLTATMEATREGTLDKPSSWGPQWTEQSGLRLTW